MALPPELSKVLTSPETHRPLKWFEGKWQSAQGDVFALQGGFFDFAPQIEEDQSLSWQRAMEAPLISGIYERHWRPFITRLGSSLTYQQEQEWITRHQKKAEGTLLDLACGSGKYLRQLAQDHPNSLVLGLDLSRSMLRECRRSLGSEFEGRVFLARANAQALPLAGESLGGMNCFAALHLFPDPQKALQEAHRVLKPGGCLTLMAAVQGEGNWANQVGQITQALRFNLLDPVELEHWLTEAGFGLLDNKQEGFLGLVAAKKL